MEHIMLAVRRALAVGALIVATSAGVAAADDYPSRPIRLVVPLPAGGGNTLLARIVAPKLSERLGQPVVVDNRSGAGGTIGSDLVAKAPPDGYTILMGYIGSHGTNPAVSKLPYDAVKDFAPISLIAQSQNVVVAHPSLGVDTIGGLIALAKAKPGVLDFATAGTGTATHLAGEMLKLMAGIDLVAIPYKGAAPAIADTASGQVKLMFPSLLTASPFIESGKLVALAVTGARRSPRLPDVPTVAESGLPGYDVVQWYGLLAPAGTPSEIVDRLNRETVAVMQLTEIDAALARQGADVITSTPAEFGAYIAREIAKWTKLVKDTGIKIE
jgi:tripartite-type tricarboxylate transporter receptor subunit TctC